MTDTAALTVDDVMCRLAANRATVIVTWHNRIRLATLIYWPPVGVQRCRARVEFRSGGRLSVPRHTITIPEDATA